MSLYKPENGRRYFRIDIVPIFNDVEFKYRVIVCDVSVSESGKEVGEVRDIMHYNTLLDATGHLATMAADPDGYAEYSVLDKGG